MTLHSEILFLEIIKLYFKNNSNPLPLKNLKNAFYTLLEIISIKERKKYYFNFNEALAHFKDIAEDYINIDNESLFLREETEMLESLILEHLNSNFSSLDYDIEEYIHNIAMYKVLNITIPLDKTKDLFNLNRKIMDTIYKIAELEITEKPNNNEIDYLKELLRDIYSNFQTIALDELTDIKMCCAYYNFLANTIDTSWQIALFSNNPTELSSLATKLIEFICPELELKLKNGEEDINEIFDNELIILLINLLLSLNLYLKNNKNSPGYEELTHRKYLLLALPDLKAILDYFLSNKTIDDLKLQSNKMIIRDSYLYLLDSRVSIKKYYGDYEELIRVEVKFANNGEMEHYKKESWMGKDITNTPLGFDAYLSKLNREEFLKYYNNLIK